jgi:hypothetical protein
MGKRTGIQAYDLLSGHSQAAVGSTSPPQARPWTRPTRGVSHSGRGIPTRVAPMSTVPARDVLRAPVRACANRRAKGPTVAA